MLQKYQPPPSGWILLLAPVAEPPFTASPSLHPRTRSNAWRASFTPLWSLMRSTILVCVPAFTTSEAVYAPVSLVV